MDTPNNNNNLTNTSTEAVKKNTLMAALAYIGPLVIVSYLTAKDDPFVKFHIKQGLVLFVIEVAVWILGMMLYPLWMIFNIINFATLILAIVGIIRVTKCEEKELPIVGKYDSYFKV